MTPEDVAEARFIGWTFAFGKWCGCDGLLAVWRVSSRSSVGECGTCKSTLRLAVPEKRRTP